MNKLELGISAPMHLAKNFGSSNHACFRRYVECTKYRCALLVLEKHELAGNTPLFKVRDYFQSDSFTTTFGVIEWPEQLGYKWEFAKDYYFKRRIKTDGAITLSTKNGEVDFEYHFFNNTYNGFVLLFPYGEKKKTKTRIVVKH